MATASAVIKERKSTCCDCYFTGIKTVILLPNFFFCKQNLSQNLTSKCYSYWNQLNWTNVYLQRLYRKVFKYKCNNGTHNNVVHLCIFISVCKFLSMMNCKGLYGHLKYETINTLNTWDKSHWPHWSYCHGEWLNPIAPQKQVFVEEGFI